MKKNYTDAVWHSHALLKTLLFMKLVLFLLLFCIIQSFALETKSQNVGISISAREMKLEDIFEKIESVSKYRFAYNKSEIDVDKTYSVNFDNIEIGELLNQLFQNENIHYTILDRQVVLSLNKNQQGAEQPEKPVSGKITDASGIPLPGVTVVIKGTTHGTVTDEDGKFSLKSVPENATLVFSFVGMKTQEIQAADKSTFNVVMKADAIGIEEVVAIGYGTMTKKELTASVSSIQSGDLVDRTTAFNIMESMAGKVAGVRNVSFSGKPGGASSLRIRGMGSINANSDPIYVLDGVVGVDPQIINSENIESIDILKDAAATAMYGAKGSNGVVIITTKSGKKGTGSINYSGKLGVGFMNRKIDVLNADEFMEVQKKAYAYSGKVMPHLTTPMENLFYYSKDAAGNYLHDENGNLIASPKYDTDWQDEITQKAITNDHTLSFSSGTEKTSVYSSIAYQDFQGLVKYTYSKRFSGTMNLKSDINKWFSVQAVITTGSSKSNDMEGGFGQGPIRNMLEMPPIIPVKYEDGTWGRKSDYPLAETAENPIRLLQDQKKISDNNFTVFNLITTIKFSDKLQFTAKGDMQTANKRNINYAKAGLLDVSETNNGYADIYNEIGRNWSNEDYFTYTNSFFGGKLQSNFVLGASWYYYRMENSSSGSENYFDDYFDYYNLGAGTTYHKPASGMTQNTMNSFYFRMNHNWKDKYLFGLTFRADGASNFGANNKYGYFPSASAAWRISEEEFFDRARNVVSNLKLRASYGAVGNASIPNYRTISSYANNSTIFNKTLQPYVLLDNLGNEDLKWESSTQVNIGVDMGFFNNRIELLMDYYNKATKDLLFSKQVPYTTGYSNTWTNLGEIVNKGFELTLSSKNIVSRNFNWTTDIVFSTNKLLVKDIGGETIDTGNGTIAREGEQWASYFMFKRIGTWGLDEVAEAAVYGKKPGDLKYEDVNKDGVIDDADRQIQGNGLPKGDLNLVNTFKYKGFSLMVDLNYNYGSKILGITSTMLENRQIYGNNRTSVLDAWTPENQNSMIAAIRLPSDVNFGENEKDSRMLYNGDFLRIRNITFSYNFDKKMLSKLKFVQNLNVGVNVENLHVFTSFPGYDPELGAFSTDTGQGIEFYSYPRPTTVSASINVTF